MSDHFDFRCFRIEQDRCAMKVGTDGVLLGAWANGGSNVLDVGTGTGVVALIMAQRFPSSHVTAIDIDSDAARQAADNCSHSTFSERIEVKHLSLQDFAATSLRFSAIVCNPPFFTNSLLSPDSQRTTARHAVSLTLADLAHAAATLLSNSGELSVVLPYDQRQRMEEQAVFAGLFVKRICTVCTKAEKAPSRLLMAFTNTPCDNLERTTLTIGDDAYRSLTSDIYKELRITN